MHLQWFMFDKNSLMYVLDSTLPYYFFVMLFLAFTLISNIIIQSAHGHACSMHVENNQ